MRFWFVFLCESFESAFAYHALKTTTFTNNERMACIYDEMHFLCPSYSLKINETVGHILIPIWHTKLFCFIAIYTRCGPVGAELQRLFIWVHRTIHSNEIGSTDIRHKRFNTCKLKPAALPFFLSRLRRCMCTYHNYLNKAICA